MSRSSGIIFAHYFVVRRKFLLIDAADVAVCAGTKVMWYYTERHVVASKVVFVVDFRRIQFLQSENK